MTYNVFGGTLSLPQSINHSVFALSACARVRDFANSISYKPLV